METIAENKNVCPLFAKTNSAFKTALKLSHVQYKENI